MSSSRHTDVVCLDFKMALDSVAHNELLVKLWNFGITGSLWHWFRGYLSCRSVCVWVNHMTSSLLPVISGVPQGSILGPLLFVVFINELPLSLSSSHLLIFAEDTKCLKQINEVEDYSALQQDLHNLTLQSDAWDLPCNESKCILPIFSSRPIDPSLEQTYYVKNYYVAIKKHHKDLGIIMSTDLSWRYHYDYLLSKAYKTPGLLHRTLARSMPIHTKKDITL